MPYTSSTGSYSVRYEQARGVVRTYHDGVRVYADDHRCQCCQMAKHTHAGDLCLFAPTTFTPVPDEAAIGTAWGFGGTTTTSST